MMETDADRLDSIRALGGVSVRGASTPFEAIFDREYQGAAFGGVQIESRAPVLTCRTCDVFALPKDETFTVTGEAETFRLKKAHPSVPAPGWTTLELRI